MASRKYEKRQMLKCKAKKADDRYVAALRREAVNYEHISESSAARMSKERLEETMRHGKRRKGITGAGIGMPLAMAAAALLATRQRS